MTEMEFRLVNDEEMPPVVITMNDRDEPKVVLNAQHKIWLCLHRKTIAGSAEAGDDPPVGKKKKKKYIYQKGLRKWWKQNIDGDGR